MSFGIYKQGQGYWVRVMTAAFVGVIIISAAAWGWGQAGAVRLPAREWTLSLNNVHGSIQAGDSLELFHYNDESDTPDIPVSFGTATVDKYDESRGSTATVVLSNFANNELRDGASEAIRVQAGDDAEPVFSANIRGSNPTPIFPIEYLQSGIAGGIMLLGTVLLYIFIGSKKGTVEFLIATDGEMKKVNWTSYREVKGSTIVVIVATFLIAGFLFGVDSLFAYVFHLIGVLER